ncbi:uncharacterized protein K441DRAFT_596210 [Cenococcum geophilum 1.58]|uniref:Uncharacterized protein n=1 Tax=Cenococcum geophilum 1.58 TaxID=794803 RepID=A0ACC8ELP5_9PEZI|nr:hypothetical protein K441DRAFT_596210 [Cenococcum geophilum 1.58]
MIVPSSRLSPLSTPLPSLSAGIKPPFRVHVFHQSSSTVPPPKLPPLLLNFEDCLKGAAESVKVRGRELLHHYITTTSITLATDQPAQIVWQRTIPQLAASHRFLVHGILAITLLHLARLRGDAEGKETLIATAASQFNIALSLFRHVITNVTAENCEALFAFSALVCVFIFNTSHEECQAVLTPKRNTECAGRKTQTAEMTRIAIGMFRTLRGSLVILFPGWDWISRSPLSPLCTRKWWPKPPIPVDAEAVLEDHRLAALERLWMQPGKDYEYAFQVLTSALTQLRYTFALVSQLTRNPSSLDPNYRNVYDQCDNGKLIDRGAIFTWPTSVPEEFIALIENQRPEALAILAHYAILPGRIRGVWWIEGWGVTLVTTAALVLGEERKSWIEWPVRVVGLEWENILG